MTKEGFDLDGVTNLTLKGDEITFFYKGDINIVSKALSTIKVKDINIEEPTLEEVFMHYYK